MFKNKYVCVCIFDKIRIVVSADKMDDVFVIINFISDDPLANESTQLHNFTQVHIYNLNRKWKLIKTFHII